MIRITPSLWLDERDIETSFVRAAGPGGQHVNKTSSAVQLRYDTRHLPEGVRERLLALAGSRATREGEIVIQAQEHRSQTLNRAAALQRLVELLQQAAHVPRHRVPTRPTAASRRRRLQTKALRGDTKAMRRKVGED
ncbi:aminoacyl-tRNA hydrolase [Verticiella sediminum]|uniref:Aminoacyl-tRNA hydrolase n=1 Tax=Verticiella sediminum TaxID=1247510 RepID=A0A556ASA7_9BURK|nr:alternative ribosome rescue aminoacyl-tRNA hydrolase ArfB [Verticiella sediminum]TSH95806.1 aminoacyl-tRNA hydrolase [Verticiella sediminum]